MKILFENDPRSRYEALAISALDLPGRGGSASTGFYVSDLSRPTDKGRAELKTIVEALIQKASYQKHRDLIAALKEFKDKISLSKTGEDINKIVNDLIPIAKVME